MRLCCTVFGYPAVGVKAMSTFQLAGGLFGR